MQRGRSKIYSWLDIHYGLIQAMKPNLQAKNHISAQKQNKKGVECKMVIIPMN